MFAPSKAHTGAAVRFDSRSRWDAPYMESRYVIGQLAQPAAHFVDFDDSRRTQPAVEHVRPLAHLWKHVEGRDGPCMRWHGLDGELAGQFIRIVPAARQTKAQAKPCDRMLHKLRNELAAGRQAGLPTRTSWQIRLQSKPGRASFRCG